MLVDHLPFSELLCRNLHMQDGALSGFLVGYGQPPAASGLGLPRDGRRREPSMVGVGFIHGRENLAFGFGFEQFDARSGPNA